MMHDPDRGDVSDVHGSEPVGLYSETLARLYLRQGFGAKALSIYRHLARRQPENRRLWDQIEALEGHLAAAVLGEAEAQQGLPPLETEAKVSQNRLARTQQVIGQLERWLAYLRR
ncbi:hypothetical protein NKDENANG_03139 [Candidatus Entotheonellaceae bacterium PAL068K]